MILITNDDGIDAPGIRTLQEVIQQQGQDHWVVAPQRQLSGCGHQVTTDRVFQVEQRLPQAFAVAGTPADCVRVGLHTICPEVEWVLSGINAGGNMGADLYISGTVAAAREAALNGIKAIAISHYRKVPMLFDWQRASQWTAQLLGDLLHKPLDPGCFWNINLPHLPPDQPDPEVVFCAVCSQPLPIAYQIEGDQFRYIGRYDDRRRDPESDTEICLSGRIAVSLICL